MSKFRIQQECYWGFIRYGFLIPKFAANAAYKVLQICVATTQLQTIFLGMKEPRTIHCPLLGVRCVQNNTPTAVGFSGKWVEVTHSFPSIQVPSSGNIPVVLLSLFHQVLQLFPACAACLWCCCDRVVTTRPCLGTEAAAAALLAAWQMASGWTGAVGLWRGACSPGSCWHHPALQPSVGMHSLHAHVVCTHGNVIQKYSVLRLGAGVLNTHQEISKLWFTWRL